MNKQLILFFILFPFSNMVNNLVHPVTPAYVKLTNMPNYMFGLLFSAMAFPGFFTSPIWGAISDRIGRLKVMRICVIGYALGQLGFSTFRTPVLLISARIFSGFFASAFLVMSLSYITDLYEGKERVKYLSFLAALYTLTTSLGYFVGGFVGKYNIFYAFRLQFVLLITFALSICKILPESLKEENKVHEKLNLKIAFSSLNFKKNRNLLTLPIIIFFIGVIVTEFSRIGFLNNFNYYMKDILDLSPDKIGNIMGLMGILSLFVNLIINPLIIRHFKIRKVFPMFILLNSIVGICIVLSKNIHIAFIGFALLFSMVNAICVPIQQSLYTDGQNLNYGLLSGYFNSSKSLGMVTGALITGFIYDINSIFPFITISITLFIASIIYFINYNQFKKI